MTPEGKVKAAVSKLLAPYIKRGDVYKFMPVQSGFGNKTLDYLLCVDGCFIAIETKRPGKVPTALQEMCIREIEAAGGIAYVIDSEDCSDFRKLRNMLEQHASSSQSQAQSDRRAA